MGNRLNKVTLIATINGVEYALDEPLGQDESEMRCDTMSLQMIANSLAAKLGELNEVEGVFPRTDASKYKMTEDGKVIQRPDSDFKK